MASPIHELLGFFDQEYTRAIGARYPVHRGKDPKLLKDLLAIYSDPELRLYIAAFFQSDDAFIQQSGYSLGVFRACLPKVIASLRAPVAPRTKTETLIDQNAAVVQALLRRRAT